MPTAGREREALPGVAQEILTNFPTRDISHSTPIVFQRESMMRPIASRLKGYDSVSVWQEFSGLANQHGAVNLGQGYVHARTHTCTLRTPCTSYTPYTAHTARKSHKEYAAHPLTLTIELTHTHIQLSRLADAGLRQDRDAGGDRQRLQPVLPPAGGLGAGQEPGRDVQVISSSGQYPV